MFGFILESIGTTELLLLVFAFLLVSAVVIILLSLSYFSSKSKTKSLKKCPYCAEMIQEEAIVCRYCGRDV